MKHLTRKLASILMALAIIVTMLPTALAIDLCPNCNNYSLSPTGWAPDHTTGVTHSQYCYMCAQTVHETHYFVNGVCTVCGHASSIVGGTGYTSCANANCTGYLNGVWSYDSQNPSYHYQQCSFCHTLNYAGHSYNTLGQCTGCGHYNSGAGLGSGTNSNGLICSNPACNSLLSGIWSFNPLSPNSHYQQCANCTTINYSAHVNNTQGICSVCGYYPGTGSTPGSNSILCDNPACNSLLAGVWTYNPLAPDYHSTTCICGTTNYRSHTFNTLGICTACGISSTLSGTPGTPGMISLSIAQGTGVYYFTEATQSGLSVYDSLRQSISTLTTFNPADYYVTFTTYDSSAATLYAPGYLPGNSYISGYGQTVTCRLSDLSSVYLYIASAGTWSAGYSITLANTTPVASGTLSISIAGSTGSDIIYSAALGNSVPLSRSDFSKFWQQYTNNAGTLNYVQITSVSGLSGTLCYNHTGTESVHQTAYGSAFYYTPSAQQKDLSKLTFVPTKVGNNYTSGTATIRFTAYGTASRNSINSLISASGTITISYTKNDVQGITYDATGSYINLSSSDFTGVYKNAVSNSVSTPYFTIKFLDLPSYGKLYSSFSSSGYNSIRNELTTANLGSYSFYNNSSSANSIDKVVYVPDGTSTFSDTIRYAAYSGSTLLYIGTVTFNTKPLVISYDSSSAGVTFASYDFYYGSTPLSQSVYISFGKPTSGTLYKDYSAGKGTAVTTNDFFSYYAAGNIGSLSDITYIPNAGFTGVVEIPFYVTTLTNAQTAGTVRIYVAADVFTDVPATSWAAAYINRLYASGVVNGTSATTFSPKANMKYGEALKMILLAAGYSKQSETGGTHWASNYLSLAYRNGIVSSTNVDLNTYIDRNTVAEIAAKAMGLASTTSINPGVIPPVDSTNGYVYALYNAGIVNGEVSGNVSYFHGSRNITREEVAKIICNIMDYSK